jgi:hypothetical protein
MILLIFFPNQLSFIDDKFNDDIKSLKDYLRHLTHANKYEIVL